MPTKRGWLPTTAARTMLIPNSSQSAAHFDVEIVDDLQILRQKPDRHDYHVRNPAGRVQLADAIADVRFQPGCAGGPLRL